MTAVSIHRVSSYFSLARTGGYLVFARDAHTYLSGLSFGTATIRCRVRKSLLVYGPAPPGLNPLPLGTDDAATGARRRRDKGDSHEIRRETRDPCGRLGAVSEYGSSAGAGSGGACVEYGSSEGQSLAPNCGGRDSQASNPT